MPDPDGHKTREPLSDGILPSQHMSASGPTVTLK